MESKSEMKEGESKVVEINESKFEKLWGTNH
jgi:hypothetical protein